MQKAKVTFFENFKGNFGGEVQEFKRGDQTEMDEDRAFSLNHRKIVIFGHHKLIGESGTIYEKEQKKILQTKEEKHAPVTKASIKDGNA